MTVDTPLTCYICGETSDRQTVDLIGCFQDQKAAEERFEEKHGSSAGGYIDICPDCRDKNPYHAKNTEEKYSIYT